MHLHVRLVKNLLEHQKSCNMAILYEGHATINLVDLIRNHSGLLQESWPDSSSNSFLPNKDCDEILWAGTKIYRNNRVIPDNIGFASRIHFIPRAIDMIRNYGRPLAFLSSLNYGKGQHKGTRTK